eukprot:GGOE01012807.1.p1 GENE.GGOE01012807.1~~GGOE01012807.1.p1  ORF type:complete len:406 (-),score=122.49 GGOE01012807.1:1595-2782(-)
MASAQSGRVRSSSTPRVCERAEVEGCTLAAPFSARAVRPTTPMELLDAPEIQRAVIATPANEAEVAEGSVVDDPSKAALRVIKETFTPFVIVRTQSTVFVIHTRFGQGLSSIIYQVEDRVEDMFFALKVVPLCDPFTDETLGTAALLRRMKHKHIVPCYDHFRFVTNGVPFLCLKLPFCPRGSLGDLIRWKSNSGGKISAAHISGYITQLASALQYLHQQGLLHGDLRPENVLLATDTEVRLIGLTHSIGLRCRSVGPVTVTGGQRLYAPPEWASSTIRGRALHPTEVPLPSYDMWGLGCLLTELCTTKLLEDRLGLHGTPLALDTSALEAVQRQMQTVHKGVFAPLSQGLLDLDPDNRLSAEDVHEALQVTAMKMSSWSDVIARPLKLLKVSLH